jgi:hypothetical protein
VGQFAYAAEMLRDEFTRQPLEQRQVQLQWHMLRPEHKEPKEEELARLNKMISQFTEYWTKESQPSLHCSSVS